MQVNALNPYIVQGLRVSTFCIYTYKYIYIYTHTCIHTHFPTLNVWIRLIPISVITPYTNQTCSLWNSLHCSLQVLLFKSLKDSWDQSLLLFYILCCVKHCVKPSVVIFMWGDELDLMSKRVICFWKSEGWVPGIQRRPKAAHPAFHLFRGVLRKRLSA